MIDCDPRLSYRPAVRGPLSVPAQYCTANWRVLLLPGEAGEIWLVKLLRRGGSYVYGREVDHRWAEGELAAHRKAQAVLVHLLDDEEAKARARAGQMAQLAATIEG